MKYRPPDATKKKKKKKKLFLFRSMSPERQRSNEGISDKLDVFKSSKIFMVQTGKLIVLTSLAFHVDKRNKNSPGLNIHQNSEYWCDITLCCVFGPVQNYE